MRPLPAINPYPTTCWHWKELQRKRWGWVRCGRGTLNAGWGSILGIRRVHSQGKWGVQYITQTGLRAVALKLPGPLVGYVSVMGGRHSLSSEDRWGSTTITTWWVVSEDNQVGGVLKLYLEVGRVLKRPNVVGYSVKGGYTAYPSAGGV
eukprot:766543-Hanusia_phi.AAC.1